jgi:spore coat polysaccharide biosynthesis protein SpsF
MPEYGIVIQARSRASRLPDKVLLPFHEGQSILEIISSNLKQNITRWPICIVTSTHPADDRIEETARKMGVYCYRGDEENVLSRFIEIGRLQDLKYVVRVCADNPFLNPSALIRLISSHAGLATKADYISYQVNHNLPSIRSHIGIYAELASYEALKLIPELTNERFYFEHVTNFLYENPGRFNIQFLKAPSYVYGRTDIRLTIDTKDDYELLQNVYEDTVQYSDDVELLVSYLNKRQDILKKMRILIAENKK